MIELYQILDYIRLGFDNNTVVYDDQAEHGVITTRLFSLLKITAKRNFYGDIKTVYAPNDVALPWNYFTSDTTDDGKVRWDTVFGIPLMWTDLLGQESQALKYYKYLGGTLPEGHKSLIVAVCESGQVLLGACNRGKQELHRSKQEIMVNKAVWAFEDCAASYGLKINSPEVRNLLEKYMSKTFDIVGTTGWEVL